MKAIASHNGLQATHVAFDVLKQGGSPLDACVGGVTLVEDDPEELTVGYGGLPNEEGIVELDAAVMDGPSYRGGAVAALRGIRHPTKVARLVMEQTTRVMLTGEGAQKFARACGFCEEDLLTDKARRMWHYWLRGRTDNGDWRPPDQDEADLDLQQWFERHFYGGGGTVHCAALDAAGRLACATSTSGHAFKMPGRVGDSPILGAGLYVDNDIGSCGAIGNGEATMQHCSSYAVVELMRAGRSPLEAGLEALRRIADKIEPSIRDEDGRPKFNLQLFVLAKDGTHAGVAMRGKKQISVTDESGTRLEDCSSI